MVNHKEGQEKDKKPPSYITHGHVVLQRTVHRLRTPTVYNAALIYQYANAIKLLRKKSFLHFSSRTRSTFSFFGEA
ncbi:hypothetical protein evm_012714 [Chilo suppressalis]|nr:hypothetical protein evm_012714 [Chilo suppressalis]